MRLQFDLPKPPRIEHADVLRCWRWFRSQLIQIYEFSGLPATFSEHDGEIAIIERIRDTQVRFTHPVPKFNYGSRGQTLRFQDGARRVEIHIFRSEIGDHFRFDYQDTGSIQSHVGFYIAPETSYLEVDDSSPQFAQWEESVRPLATLV